MSAGPTDTLEQRHNVSVGPADVTSVYKTDVTSVAATDLAAGGCNRYNPFGGDDSCSILVSSRHGFYHADLCDSPQHDCGGSSPERHIRKIELESAAQHRRLTNDLIDLNWARFGAREDVGEGSE
ncbi:hypothetical protein PCASD_24514 [Puccinia coronata f. sp. avenae]|uniref:Uncharacterized protein n=1 Tax=Puccinia coronata f. sp. avenae TaxID=200324 RepID=A0A2N5S8X1_9BASI|nr:hypothetical protein PCASD_24514 [Puccinia coronata f. sp. avenae]